MPPMVTDLNPQAAQMGHASMVRTLDAQARAIWPQEERLFLRYGLAADIDILDVGCGTGEITLRLAALYPHASLLGVDLLEGPLTIARSRAMGLGDRVRFAPGDAFALDLPDAAVDLAVCRHMLHAVPEPARVLGELRRVTRPGGRLHVIAEDYGMIHAPAGPLDPDELWQRGVFVYTRKTDTDARIGRHAYTHMQRVGLEDISVDYVVVDTLRVDREVFASIIDAWREGYADTVAEHSGLDAGFTHAALEQVAASIRNPEHYVVWQVPVLSGRVSR